jgi:hypothetical protein
MDIDLTQNKFRQKVLELLAEVETYNNNTKREQQPKTNDIKLKLKKLLIEMKDYMDKNQLRDNLFMKVLCDDVFISYKTFGTRHSSLYTHSRQTSQGKQEIYNNTRMPHDDYRLLPLTQPIDYDTYCVNDSDSDYDIEEEEEEERGGAIDACGSIKLLAFEDEDDDDDIFSNHTVLESDVSPYANLKTVSFMKEISK